MITNIFKNEFNRIFKSTLFWTLFLSILIIIDMVLYVEMLKSGMFDQMLDMMKNPFIGNMIKGFGVNPEQLTDILGFYVTRNTSFELLIGGIYAVTVSSSLISLEEYEKTAEFLFTRPVTRTEIMTGKLMAFQTNLLILNIVTAIVGYICLEIFKKEDYKLYSYFILCVYSYLLMLLFGGIGLFFSMLVKRGRVFTGATIGIVLGTYFLEIISKITESASFLGYFSPFKYVDKEVLKSGYNLDQINFLIFFGGTLILTIISYRIFRRKDIIL